MRTFEEIYLTMLDKGDNRFSIKELLDVFKNERSWIGTTQQLLNIRSLQHELTGIRPGECSNCNVEVMQNMVKWLNKYEADRKPPEVTPEEKPKRKRIGE